MKDSDDIANLLKQFGGRPEEYYEIGRASDARDSQARWPLLSSIEATQGEHHPPVQPHTPGAAPTPGGLRARLAPTAADPRAEPRVEPRFAPASEPTPAAPAAAPVSQPAAVRPAPRAQFVPPRPRGHIVPPTRPSAPPAGAVAGMQPPAPASRLPDTRAPEPVVPDAFVTAPPPSPFATAPRTPAQVPTVSPVSHAAFTRPEPVQAPSVSAPAAPEPSTPLQAIFHRLSRPAPAPEPAAPRDKHASLLQRLSRL